MVTLADGLVNGSVNANGTKANILADVSCINSTPRGNVSGSVEFFSGGPIKSRFSFSSNDAFIVSTRKKSGFQSVNAVFTDVTVRNLNSNVTTSDCTLFLTATKFQSGTWEGSFVITCPNGLNLVVFGGFRGNVIVNREVFCRPLL